MGVTHHRVNDRQTSYLKKSGLKNENKIKSENKIIIMINWKDFFSGSCKPHCIFTKIYYYYYLD